MSPGGELGGFTRENSESKAAKENEVRRPQGRPRHGVPGRPIRILLYIALAVTGALALFAIFGEGSSDLEVRSSDLMIRGDNHAISVRNVGTKTITITNIFFNDRIDCGAARVDSDMFNPHAAPTFPMKLQVGDRTIFSAGCGVVRTTIVTTDGKYSYSFN